MYFTVQGSVITQGMFNTGKYTCDANEIQVL
uniref:Uncharacterized protein n=1 Tax=Anguilla anguilla TaxID=7936 RepID=A0A0E9Q8I1_ANGAN